jgi:hypothetical protein
MPNSHDSIRQNADVTRDIGATSNRSSPRDTTSRLRDRRFDGSANVAVSDASETKVVQCDPGNDLREEIIIIFFLNSTKSDCKQSVPVPPSG